MKIDFAAEPAVGVAIEDWRQWLAHERRISPHTLDAYTRDLRKFLLFISGHLGFPPGLVFQGTPEQVTKQIDEMHQALGFQELFLWVCTGLFDHQVMMRQLELFAIKVAPHFGAEQG